MKLKLSEMQVTNKKTTDDDAKVEYFKLENGKSGKFRFLFTVPDEEFEAFAVHVYKDGKRFGKIHCPRGVGGRDYESCIICSTAGDDRELWQKQIVFIPMWSEDEQKVVIWERSLKYFINNLLNPLFLDTDMCDGKEIYSTVFKITRQGDMQDTTYAINKLKTDEQVIPEGLEIPNASKYIARKTLSEMMEYLRTRTFPPREKRDYTQDPAEQAVAGQPKPWEQLGNDDVPF